MNFFLTTMVAITMVSMATCCSPPMGYQPMTIEQEMYGSDIVVYGRVSDIVMLTNNSDHMDVSVNSTLMVYCVFKKDGQDIPEQISLNNLVLMDPCTSMMHVYSKDATVILGLKRVDADSFKLFEFGTLDVPMRNATDENLGKVASVCTLQTITLPIGRDSSLKSMCPTPPADDCQNPTTKSGVVTVTATIVTMLMSALISALIIV